MRRFHFVVKGGLGLSFAAALLATASCYKPLKDLSLDFVMTETAVIRQGETLQLPFSVGEAGSAALEVKAVSDNSDYVAAVEMSETDAASGVLKLTAPKYILAPATVNVEVSAVDEANSRTVKKSVAVSAEMAAGFQELSAAANTYREAWRIRQVPGSQPFRQGGIRFRIPALAGQEGHGGRCHR